MKFPLGGFIDAETCKRILIKYSFGSLMRYNSHVFVDATLECVPDSFNILGRTGYITVVFENALIKAVNREFTESILGGYYFNLN
ncbi:hypothetical protein HZS_1852 [Henneguya salminicola]|nr:hypothetical protein HZS_1852 [Henneguya salminicola]